MSFLQPGLAIAALVMAAVPFLLHLLLRRPRATAWPSTMLLRRAIERLRRRRRLEQWVLLAMRALALALVGLGMAGPIARSLQADRSSRELWIVLDDGATSAERLADGSRALDASRATARRELDTLQAGDRVALVTGSRPIEVRVEPTTDLDRVRRELDASTVRAVTADLVGAIERCLPADPAAARGREVLVASSFRRGSVDVERPIPAAWTTRSEGMRWIASRPLATVAMNRAVLDARVGRGPGEVTGSGEAPVRVELGRAASGSSPDGVLVRGSSGELLGRADFTWTAAGTETRQDVRARSPKDGAFIVEAPEDVQPLDDTVTVVSSAGGVPRVALLARRSGEGDLERLPASTWIVRALESAGIQPQEVDPSTLALRPPRDADTIVVARPDLLDAAGWTWLGRFARDGGTLVLMPAADLARQAWVPEMERSLQTPTTVEATATEGSFRLAARQPRGALLSLLGAEVDALAEPVSMQRRWALRATAPDAQAMLQFEDGSPAALVARPRDGVGVVVTLAFTPEVSVTDLPLKPFMVPLFQELARAGRVVAASQQSCWSGEPAWLGSAAAGGLLRSSDGAVTLEIDGEGRTMRPIPAPGLWKVEQRDGRRRWIAVRLDPRAASVDRVEPDAFEAWRAATGPWIWQGERVDTGTVPVEPDVSPWTFPLLATALVMLLAESGWSRRGSPRRSNLEPAA